MSTHHREKSGSRWAKIQRRIRADEPPCGICHDPIDYSLKTPHPDSFEVDHIVPVSRGGAMYDPRNLQASHRKCNRAKGDKLPEEYEREIKAQVIEHSRIW